MSNITQWQQKYGAEFNPNNRDEIDQLFLSLLYEKSINIHKFLQELRKLVDHNSSQYVDVMEDLFFRLLNQYDAERDITNAIIEHKKIKYDKIRYMLKQIRDETQQ